MTIDFGRPGTFERILFPISLTEFCSRFWKRDKFWHPGDADKFAGLLSWEGFGKLLEHHWREPSRVRIVRAGRDSPTESYVNSNDTGIGRSLSHLKVLSQLQNGATIVIHAVDELHEPLRFLAESLELTFGASCRVNVYASWGEVNGLGLHRDDLEIFIMHVEGHKKWSLYGTDENGRPSEEPAFECTMSPGDLLYIPRHCYHVAHPVDEPTFHLTVSIKYPRNSTLLGWMVDHLKDSEFGGRDLPEALPTGDRARAIREIREIIAQFSDLCAEELADKIDEFYEQRRIVRPRFPFPWNVTAQGVPPTDEFCVRLASPYPLQISQAEHGVITVSSEGKHLRFPALMTGLIDRLNDTRRHSFADLRQSMPGTMSESAVRTFVGMLSRQNLVVIET